MRHFSARTLPAAEMTALAEHLTSCGACRQQFHSTRRTSKADALLSFTLAPEILLRHEHLEYEQLAHYLDAGSDAQERDVIDLHLSACEQCRMDVESLREFRREIAPEMSVSYAPAERDFERRVIRPISAWFGWLRPAYAAAAAVVVLVALVAVLSLSDRGANEQRAQVSQPSNKSGGTSPEKSPVSAPPIAANDNVASAGNIGQADNNPGNTNAPAVTPRIQPTPAQAQAPIQRIKKSRSASKATVAEINDGNQKITVDLAGNVTGLDRLKPADAQIVKETLLAQNIAKPSELSELVGEQGVLRGNASAGQTFRLLSPARIVTANDRPTFKWEALPGATSYRVYVGDANNREIAGSGELPATVSEWTPNTPLPRGKVLTWAVIAKVEGRDIISPAASQPEVKFKVLPADSLRELDTLQNRPRSHLAMGLFYARAGMLEEAEREFNSLARQNPNSPLALKLLRSVQSWR